MLFLWRRIWLFVAKALTAINSWPHAVHWLTDVLFPPPPPSPITNGPAPLCGPTRWAEGVHTEELDNDLGMIISFFSHAVLQPRSLWLYTHLNCFWIDKYSFNWLIEVTWRETEYFTSPKQKQPHTRSSAECHFTQEGQGLSRGLLKWSFPGICLSRTATRLALWESSTQQPAYQTQQCDHKWRLEMVPSSVVCSKGWHHSTRPDSGWDQRFWFSLRKILVRGLYKIWDIQRETKCRLIV